MQRSDHRRIADGLREQIIQSRLPVGARLPSTRELATTWRASLGTIYNALQTLAKEGWIERVHGSGTFVADFKNQFACAGIYHCTDIFAREESVFSRALHTALLDQLHKMGKKTLVFVDSRPENKQGQILPTLAEAVTHRLIQCLIAPTLNEVDAPALVRLNLPTAFPANRLDFHQIDFDYESLLGESVRHLAAQGCRSIGMISSMKPPSDPSVKDPADNFYPYFRQAAQAAGLEIREPWLRKPTTWIPTPDLERYGYREFKNLWALPEKPDGLLVWPDVVVRGAIAAILDTGRSTVTAQMKLVFHRNSRVRLLCPFPATWAISSEDRMAAGLIEMIQKQFQGGKVSPALLPYSFEEEGTE